MPTIEEDLATLNGTMVPCAQWEAAFARIRAHLADKCDHHLSIAMMQQELNHMQYGARLLTGMLKRAEANGLLVPEAAAWLAAERSRQSRKG